MPHRHRQRHPTTHSQSSTPPLTAATVTANAPARTLRTPTDASTRLVVASASCSHQYDYHQLIHRTLTNAVHTQEPCMDRWHSCHSHDVPDSTVSSCQPLLPSVGLRKRQQQRDCHQQQQQQQQQVMMSSSCAIRQDQHRPHHHSQKKEDGGAVEWLRLRYRRHYEVPFRHHPGRAETTANCGLDDMRFIESSSSSSSSLSSPIISSSYCCDLKGVCTTTRQHKRQHLTTANNSANCCSHTETTSALPYFTSSHYSCLNSNPFPLSPLNSHFTDNSSDKPPLLSSPSSTSSSGRSSDADDNNNNNNNTKNNNSDNNKANNNGYSRSSPVFSSNSFYFFVYLHIFSVIACLAATGLCVRATVITSSPNRTPSSLYNSNVMDTNHSVVSMMHSSSSPLSLSPTEEAFLSSPEEARITATITVITTDTHTIHVNPLLRIARDNAHKKQMCHVWSEFAPSDLCEMGRWARLKRLREMSVFYRDCATQSSNVMMAQLFRVDWRRIKSESDLHANVEHLRDGADARDCLLAGAGSQECLQCFQNIAKSMKDVERAFDKFNATLHRFDCMLAVDTASATRPFSPNGSCADCRIWYRKWLLVQLVNIWIEQPCINWCYFAQLACPHLATSKVADYAGHPSFQCGDVHIPPSVPYSSSSSSSSYLLSFASSPSSSHSSSSPTPSPSSSSSRIAASSTSPPTNVYSKKRKKSSSFAVSDCSCIHPCDLIEGADASPFASTSQIIRYVGDYAPQNRPEGIYDFFSSPNHCSSRRRYCDALRERQYAWKESVRRAQFRTSSTTEQSQSSREHLDSVSSTVLSPAVTPHHHPTTSAPSNRRSNNYVGSIHHPGSSNFLELPDENDGIAKSLSAYADDRYDMIQLSNGDADERNRRRQNEVYRLDSTGGDENDLGDEAMDDGYEKRAGNEPEEVDNYISEWRTTARSRRRVVMRNAESRVQWRRASSSSSASRLIASTDRYRVVSRLFLRMVTEVLFFSLFAFVVFW